MRLLLIRHGQTPENVRGGLSTDAPGPGLTELGARQAAMIPDALRDDAIDAIFVSKLVRTRLTAEPLAVDRGLQPRELDGIHEIGAGDLEDRSDKEAIRSYLETAFAWGLGDLDVRMPGGGTGHEFFERFDAGIADVVASEAATAVIISHGAAIRVWVAGRSTNVAPTFAGQHELDNTGIVELQGSPDEGWSLVSWAGLPIGGADLVDETAADPTGETLDEAKA